MWYFAWVLGLGLACTFGILNAMWYEMREKDSDNTLM
jgi:cyd operon protein YbgT